MDIYSISSQIARINRFEVSIVVILPEDRQPVYITETIKNSKKYANVRMQYPAFIQLVWPREKDGSQNGYPFSDFVLNLSQYTKNVFTTEFHYFLESYDNDDMFYLEDGELKLYGDANNKYNRLCKAGDKFVRFYPKVLVDTNGNLYEGGVLALEKEAIYAEFTFSELCALYEIIDRVDIWLYGRELLTAIQLPNLENNKKKNAFWE